jgi:hypothetical protein
MAAGIVLTNNGEEWACERLAGVQGSGSNNVAGNAGSHIGWGTSITTPVKGDTALGAESSDPASRVATALTVTGTGSSAKYQATATLPSTTSQTIQEMGLFSASTAGVLFVHCTFTGIALSSGDAISFTCTIDPS